MRFHTVCRIATASAVFLLSLSFLGAVSVSADSATIWYRSNALGFALKPLSSQPESAAAAGKGYVLEVEKTKNGNIRTLYNDGTLVQRTVADYAADGTVASETVYRGEVLFRKTQFTKSGKVAEETFYSSGSPSRKTIYRYKNGRPVSSTTYGFETPTKGAEAKSSSSAELVAVPLWNDAYSYYPGSATSNTTGIGPPVTGQSVVGALREVKRTFENGTVRISRYDYSGTMLTQEWQGSETSGILTRFSLGGQVTSRERWADGKPTTRELYTYNADNQLVSSKLEDPGAHTVTEMTYEKGKVIKETTQKDGVVVSTVEDEYDHNNITSHTVREEGQVDRYTYAYNDQGKKVEESHYIDGRLFEVTHYTGGNSSYREQYRNGKVILRTYYEGEKRTKEELIRDGTVVHTLTF